MSYPKKDQTISVQVDQETKEKASYLAALANRSLSSHIRQLLRFHIREHEFLYGPIRIEKETFTQR